MLHSSSFVIIRDGMYSSILPPGNTPKTAGPIPLKPEISVLGLTL